MQKLKNDYCSLMIFIIYMMQNINKQKVKYTLQKAIYMILYPQQEEGEKDLKNLKMKAARVGMDLSQEQLANLVGVTRQTIGMIEAGKFNPSLQLCIAICKALHKTLNDIFWEEDL